MAVIVTEGGCRLSSCAGLAGVFGRWRCITPADELNDKRMERLLIA
jgi:hypothetical protein